MVSQADEDIDLAQAALYISWIEHRDLDVDQYLEMLDTLATEASRYVGQGDGDIRATVRRLSEFLFVRQGFSSNDEDYYDPRNSCLNAVLDRRTGIPITLSLVYMEVARRIGMVFEGVGLPGHFVIRMGPPEQELYVDAFNDGQLMSRKDCEETVRNLFHGRVEFREEYLRPYTKKEFLIRILTNLKQNYSRLEKYQQAIYAADHIAMIEPSLGSNLKERASFHYSLKRYRLAIRDLETYLETNYPADDTDQIKRQIQGIWSVLRTIN